jgi:RNA polymerase sigma-70 factor, ECF subfamily
LALDDADLVHRTLRGDLEAFGGLYERYARLVRAVLWDATHDLSQAHDLAQDVFLRAFQRLPELRDPARFGAWVVGIARLAAKEWQRSQVRGKAGAHFDSAVSGESTRLATNGEDDRLSVLLDLMADLPEMERLALHAFYLESQNAEQAARTLGLSRSAFYKLLQHARERLSLRYRQAQDGNR